MRRAINESPGQDNKIKLEPTFFYFNTRCLYIKNT